SQPTPTKAGIVATATGERHIPSSVRADGSKRKEIKIRPGYAPPEDVEVYKNRAADNFRTRGQGPPPGAALKDDEDKTGTAASEKNKKRKEARKRAAEKAAESPAMKNDSWRKAEADGGEKKEEEKEVDPQVEREKKARNLRKKLKQARELKEKKEGGAALLPEQFAKVIKINELIRELDALGFDEEGEEKGKKEVVEGGK
ncbi:MAG: hypothetical protein H9W83_07010, partial [Leuconostoc sp.]|nr:hypothetical protein [Leuconostoc sp.]